MRIRTLAAAGLAAAGLASVPVVVATSGTPASAHVTEDSSHWNCRTMGNHRCGNSLPRWAHWKYATRTQAADCGPRNLPAIIVWTTHGTTSSIICRDGSGFSS